MESSFLTLLDETVEKVEKSQDIHRAATNSINSTRKMSSQQFPAQASKLSRDEETQTDTSFSPVIILAHCFLCRVRHMKAAWYNLSAWVSGACDQPYYW